MDKLKKLFSSVFKRNIDDANEPKYRCVNCAYPLKELYKTYSPTIQKLSECAKCGKTDVFIEFDHVFIFCDLILLSAQAQRHVLYNTNCKNLYKILMLVTLLESYCLFNENFDSKNNRFNKVESDDPLYLEKGYYLATFQVILSNLFFFIIIRIISAYGNNNLYRSKSLTSDLFRGFMLASIAKFFFLPIIIWRENITELNFGVLLVLVIIYFLVSLTYIHSTITGCSRKISAATILLSFMINKYIWVNLRMSGNI